MRFSLTEMKALLSTLPNDLAENETVNVHHCKEGHNNNRCYITNKGERIVFYCHHCGSSGSIANKFSAYKKATRKASTFLPKSYEMPKDCVYELAKWPVEARIWLVKGKIKDKDAIDAGLGYSPYLNRVCIPVVFDGTYRGYVARRIGDEGPKYLARAEDKEEFIFAKHSSSVGEVVLVEDILSCIRLSSLGFNCIALQGVSINTKLINYLSSFYKHYIIWLDNDNPQVKIQQAKLKRQLEMYGNVRLIKTDKDPKEFTDKEIKEILDEH